MTRALDFLRQFEAAEKHYVLNSNDTQLYLDALGTHPDWDGHNFGAAHCHWGMALASNTEVPVTLIATPTGYPLYESLGFDSIANITIGMLDSLGQMWFEVMSWNAEPED